MKNGAFAIILDTDGRVLCSLRRDMDLWNLPGGGIEANETPWDAVVREVEEETGLVVKVDRLQGIYMKKSLDVIVFSFVCSIVSGVLCLSDEAREHKYIDPAQLPENMSLSQKERIADFLNCPDVVTMKRQNHPSSRDLLDKLGLSAP